MTRNIFLSVFLCLLTTSVFAERESGGFADTSRVYECWDKSNAYFITLNMLGPNFRTLTVATSSKIILNKGLTMDTLIRCIAPCEVYKDDSGHITFSVTKIPGQLTGSLSAPDLQLELRCEIPVQGNLECDSRRKDRPCN